MIIYELQEKLIICCAIIFMDVGVSCSTEQIAETYSGFNDQDIPTNLHA
jgi:hypothetical protein